MLQDQKSTKYRTKKAKAAQNMDYINTINSITFEMTIGHLYEKNNQYLKSTASFRFLKRKMSPNKWHLSHI